MPLTPFFIRVLGELDLSAGSVLLGPFGGFKISENFGLDLRQSVNKHGSRNKLSVLSFLVLLFLCYRMSMCGPHKTEKSI